MWNLDRTSKTSLYQQIAAELEKRITLGEYPPGTLLPSERKLAGQLGVNRSTIVQAYDELRASGLVESAQGSGTKVMTHKWGIVPKITPNWKQYAEGGTFLPNLPAIRRIREALRQSSAHPLIDFASGELSTDLFVGEPLQQVLREQPFTEPLGYDDPQGFLPLRETLVAFLERRAGVRTTASSMLITSGSQQSLYLITQCLLSPGDAVAIEDPSYSYSLPMFQSAGLRLFRLPVDRRGIRPQDIVPLYKQHRIRMIFVNPNFQNPTGSVLAPERRRELLDIAAELGIPIVEDDPFTLTASSGSPPPTLKSLDSSGNVLYVGSLSKIAASGLRIGWLLAPQTIVRRLADARQQMDFGLSSLPQWAAHHLLAGGHMEQQLDRLRVELARKKAALTDALSGHMGELLSFEPPAGGLTLWCRLERPADETRLLDEAIKRGVVFTPGSVYGSDRRYLRLSFARPALAQIPRGVERLLEAWRALEQV